MTPRSRPHRAYSFSPENIFSIRYCLGGRGTPPPALEGFPFPPSPPSLPQRAFIGRRVRNAKRPAPKTNGARTTCLFYMLKLFVKLVLTGPKAERRPSPQKNPLPPYASCRRGLRAASKYLPTPYSPRRMNMRASGPMICISRFSACISRAMRISLVQPVE